MFMLSPISTAALTAVITAIFLTEGTRSQTNTTGQVTAKAPLPSDNLQEIYNQVLDHLKHGRNAEALRDWKRYCDIFRRLPNHDREKFASALQTLGTLSLNNYLFTDAEQALTEASDIIRGLWQTEPSLARGIRLADILMTSGFNSVYCNRIGEATARFDEAARILAGFSDLRSTALLSRLRFQHAKVAHGIGAHADAARLLRVADAARVRAIQELTMRWAVAGVAGQATEPHVSLLEPEEVIELQIEIDIETKRIVQARQAADLLLSQRKQNNERSASFANDRFLAQAHRLVGKISFTDNRWSEALGSFKEARRVFDKPGVGSDGDRAAIASDEGSTLAKLGNYDGAEERFTEALRLLASHPTEIIQKERWTLRTNLAITIALRQNPDRLREAISLLEQTLDEEERATGTVFPLLLDRQRRSFLAYHRWTLSVFLSVAAKTHSPDALYQRVLRFKGAAFSQGTAETIAREHFANAFPAVASGAWCGIAAMEQAELTKATIDLALLQAHPPMAAPDSVWDKREIELRTLIDRNERALGLGSPPGERQHLVKYPTVGEVVASLSPNTALIDYVEINHLIGADDATPAHIEQRFFVFIIRKDQRTAAVLLPTTTAEIAKDLREWLTTLDPLLVKTTPVTDTASLNIIGRSLAEKIWTPLVTHLPPDRIRHLIISPDGDLWRFPFAALPVGPSDDQYLIKTFSSVAFAMSGEQVWSSQTLHSRLRRPAPHALVVANIDYGKGTLKRVSLPRLLIEYPTAYETSFENSQVDRLTGVMPSRAVVLAAMERGYDDLIFCGHLGISGEPENNSTASMSAFGQRVSPPTNSTQLFFPLANANENTEARLIPRDMMVLHGCPKSVGLIGCSGIEGDRTFGEGILGFPRDCLMAGAESVWTTLWPIKPDWAEPVVIPILTDHCNAGCSMADSIAAAQRRNLTYRTDLRSHPRYWATWIVIGPPGCRDSDPPLPLSSTPSSTPTPNYSSGESTRVGVFLVTLGVVTLIAVGLVFVVVTRARLRRQQDVERG